MSIRMPTLERQVSQHEVVFSINQQQLELLDNTVAQGYAVDRSALIRRALREFAAKHPPTQQASKKEGRS
jgi:metal-responsive CopG/Arc/MetJ family transcriptional regulator